ncbi:MAG: glutamine synthetase family protein [Planctomycetota bacterium]|nr:glutamine synthetase family protein [Planctomycetota bacterium]
MSNEHDQILSLKKKLEAAEVQYCFAAFVDVHGIPKAKCVPMAKFEEMCEGTELYTVGAVEGMGLVGPQEDECCTVPDLNSCVICPWDHRFAWMSADTHYHGQPYHGDSRVILGKVLAKARDMGFKFNLGIEPEFYVLKKDATGKLAPLDPIAFKGGNACYDVRQTLGSMQFLDPMCRYIEELGWGMHSFDQECGKGQYEFDFHYTDAMTMSDRLIFLRLMAKQVAESIGAIATFMPKPFSNDFRSGAHFNMSLSEIKTGKNVFIGGEKPDALSSTYNLNTSRLCLNFVAGLLKHAPALTAVCCPTFNSYKGLIAQGDLTEMSWAPVLRCYGKNNRSAMLRLPMSRPCVENRAVDMSVNPYLAAALSLAAGLEGIAQNLDPGEPLNDNLYTLSVHDVEKRRVTRLPQTLLDAVRAFESDALVTETFGESFQRIYAEQKHKEWARGFYRVTEEERNEALNYI